ncbi:predicted protein [Nematostella vectensis]|uniref:RanBD1 domain-containing protein n=1 Tax=Nematostella vectensis TaxID=45351 RepID=A7S303_NEMVE|nr:predicted protein [Nematostella vectensis]|eukprot:XP_001633979.1 predicted protein [Nematostella vectensis]
MSEEQGTKDEVAPASPEIHFKPIVNLPKIELKSQEENEEEIFQMRAKLYRYDTAGDENLWKERGVGNVRILKHKLKKHTYRVLMRRDKTLKICANHLIDPEMELKVNCGSDRAWVWSVKADFADEEVKPETLAIKFANAENANKFKDVFQDCQKKIKDATPISDDNESDKLVQELEGLKVKEDETKEGQAEDKSDKTEPTDSEKEVDNTSKDENGKKEEEDIPEK